MSVRPRIAAVSWRAGHGRNGPGCDIPLAPGGPWPRRAVEPNRTLASIDAGISYFTDCRAGEARQRGWQHAHHGRSGFRKVWVDAPAWREAPPRLQAKAVRMSIFDPIRNLSLSHTACCIL